LVGAWHAACRPGSIIQPQATEIGRLGELSAPGSFAGAATKEALIACGPAHVMSDQRGLDWRCEREERCVITMQLIVPVGRISSQNVAPAAPPVEMGSYALW
jgi:hypothetical protein